MREQDYCSESHYRIVSPTFQYRMSHQRVGKCIIINNKNFDEKTGREKTSDLIWPDVILAKTLPLIRRFVCFAKGWMYAMVRIEMPASCASASRALVLMSSSTMTRHARRWSIFSEKVRRLSVFVSPLLQAQDSYLIPTGISCKCVLLTLSRPPKCLH